LQVEPKEVIRKGKPEWLVILARSIQSIKIKEVNPLKQFGRGSVQMVLLVSLLVLWG
jgi:hypothetical protein